MLIKMYWIRFNVRIWNLLESRNERNIYRWKITNFIVEC